MFKVTEEKKINDEKEKSTGEEVCRKMRQNFNIFMFVRGIVSKLK